MKRVSSNFRKKVVFQQLSYSKRYFQPTKPVDEYPLASSLSKGAMTCFHNGIYWVCPNPNDKELFAKIDRNFDDGHFIESRTIKVPEEEWNDEDRWSS